MGKQPSDRRGFDSRDGYIINYKTIKFGINNMKNKSLFLIMLLTLCAVGTMKAQSCDPINVTVTNPYVENFSTDDWPHGNTTNNYNLFSEYPENCWHVPYTIVADGGTPSPRLWYIDENSPRHISLKEGSSTTAQDQYVLFPAFNNPLKDLNIKFRAKLNKGGNRKLYIGYYNTETEEFTQLEEVTVYNSAYSGYGPFDLNENGNAPDTFDEKYRLAFRFPGNADQYSCDITEITVGTYLTMINSNADWVLFCNQVDDFITYKDRTVVLGNNIQISKATGGNDSESHSFRGTFNGQGHQLILNGGDFGTPVSPAANANVAPFTYVWGATFASLEVTGDIYTANQKAGGFVAVAGNGDLTFSNCRSSVNIHSSVEGDGTHGGFIALLKGEGNGKRMTATFTNCAFTGSITTTNNTTNVGGFVGWCEWQSNVYSGRCTLVLNNCVVAPNAPCISEGSKTFSRFHNEAESMHFTNCYYNQPIGDAQGMLRYTIEGELGVTAAMAGDAIIYNVSQITAYDNNEGLRYHDTLWAGEGDNVKLLLGYYGMGSVTSYYAEQGTLVSDGDIDGTDDPHTLTMPAGDVTIGANFSGDQGELTIYDGPDFNGDIPLDDATPYWDQHTQMIYPASDLALMVGREIHSMTFYATSPTPMNADRWTVALRVIDVTTLSGFAPLTDTTQIYSGYLNVANGTMTITFNHPYFYQGGNLLFDFRHEAAPDATASMQHIFRGKNVDGAAYRTRASAAGQIDFLPKVTFDYRVATSIPTPTHLTVSNITDHGATLSWEAPAYTTPSRYSYEFKKASNEWGSGSGGGSGVGGMISVTLSSLQQFTTYNFRVKAIYDGIGESAYIYTTFTTRSTPVDVGDSWFEDFEIAYNHFWELHDGYYPDKAKWASSSAANNTEGGHYSMYITNDGGNSNAYTNDHRLVVYAAKLLHFVKGKFTFSFDWKCVGEEYWDYLQVGLVPGSEAIIADSVGTSMPTGWVRLHDQEKLNGSDTWQTTPDKTITIATAGDYYVVLRWQQDYERGDNPPAAVDNIRITRMYCENDVTGLAASHFTTTTATLDWDDVDGVSGWQVAYSTESNFPEEETTIVDVNENTLDLTELTEGTTYYAKVRTHCSEAYGYGEWCNTIQFDTKCEYITEFPWKDDFNRWPSGMEYPTVFDFNDFCWVNKNISGYHHYVFKIIDASVGGSYTYQVDNGNYTHQIFMPIDYSENSEILLVLPGMTLPEGITHNYYRFALDVWRNQIDGPDPYGEGIRVFASTDDVLDEGDRELAFIPRHIHGYSATIPNEERNGYYRYSLPIGEWGNDPCYIILRGENKQCASIYMDNFEVSVIPNTFTNAYGNNKWNTAANWEPAALGIPDVTDNVEIEAEAIIPYDYVAKADRITLKGGGSIVMESGAQLWHSNEMVRATVQKKVNQFQDESIGDGFVFFGSPIVEDIDPAGVENMFPVSTIVDLYRFNPSAQLEWENWQAEGTDHYHFNLQHGRGYLYAHNFVGGENILGFNGYIKPSATPVSIDLVGGWNLIGNPFVCNAYVDRAYYKMNLDGSGVEAVENYQANPIAPCTGIMVEADAAGTVTFSKDAPEVSNNNGSLQIALAQANTRSNDRIDNAIVSFNEGNELEKFYFGTQNANIYIPQDGKDYAIADVGRDAARHVSTEIPINFKATENGEYTITVNPEGVEMDYLHLIDNMTGADIDLLHPETLIAGEDPQSAAPSYTFRAKTTDYASRFKLVFASHNADASTTGSETFAFYSNGSWFIANEGRATLQVIDVMGRILSSETISGSISKTIDAAPGVYILKLNDKVQKIVIE